MTRVGTGMTSGCGAGSRPRASAPEEPEERAGDDADHDAGSDREVELEAVAAKGEVPGKSTEAELGEPREEEPDGDEGDAEGDQETGGRGHGDQPGAVVASAVARSTSVARARRDGEISTGKGGGHEFEYVTQLVNFVMKKKRELVFFRNYYREFYYSQKQKERQD